MLLVRCSLLRLILVTILAISVTGLVLAGGIRLRLAHVYPETWPIHGALIEAAKNFEVATEGLAAIEVYPQGVLGNASEILNQVRVGKIDMVVVPAEYLYFLDPSLQSLGSSFAFRDRDHFERFLDSEVWQTVASRVERTGIKLLGASWIGPRHLLTMRSAGGDENLKGLKLGAYSSTRMEQVAYSALGAVPVNIGWAETYQAVQVGMIDATQGLPSALLETKLFKSFNTVSLDSLGGTTAWLLTNQDFEDQLPPSDRDLLVAITREAMHRAGAAAAEREDLALRKLAAFGVKTWRFDPDTRAKIQNTALTAMIASAPPETAELIEAIRDVE